LPVGRVTPDQPAVRRERQEAGRLGCACAAETVGRPALPVGRVTPDRPAAAPGSGGPEGKLRGRPPPPVEPRSGPWRRTGSESGAGRARTRRLRLCRNLLSHTSEVSQCPFRHRMWPL
jgi:hypothetical protein